MMRGDFFKVTMFNYTITEVVQRCPALAMIDD
jgi:hypothetical protein